MRGDSSNWLYIVTVGQLVAPAWFTPRTLQLYAAGMPMKSVARKMTISEATAKQYLGRVREKYSRAGRAAPTKLELYYRAVEDGHLPLLP